MAVSEVVKAVLRRPPKEVRIGLVGASNAPHKYGSIILEDLLGLGYQVLAVNPREPMIHGQPAVARPDQLKGPIDILNFVVPPEIALEVVEALPKDRFPLLWFQPGAYDARVVKAAEARAKTVVAGPCIMVQARLVG